MRLIDGDALIEKCGEWYTEEGSEEGFIGTLKQLLDKQPTVNPWIPCSERLPNESDYYLVTIINPFGEKEVCVIWFAYKADCYGVSEWRELTDDDTVLAWMPLPEPWKGEAE